MQYQIFQEKYINVNSDMNKYFKFFNGILLCSVNADMNNHQFILALLTNNRERRGRRLQRRLLH